MGLQRLSEGRCADWRIS